MYTVASPDSNPRGGGQLPNPNECHSTLTSGTSGGATPTYTIYTGGGGQLAKPNECNSTLRRGETLNLTSAILH